MGAGCSKSLVTSSVMVCILFLPERFMPSMITLETWRGILPLSWSGGRRSSDFILSFASVGIQPVSARYRRAHIP